MTRAAAEAHWVRDHGKAWVDTYARSTFDERRSAMGQAIRSVAPFGSVLDVGCHCGVLVPWLDAASPGCTFTGLDLNYEAISEGRRLWPAHEWVQGSAVDWIAAQDRCWDLVVTSSCLAHLAPEDIGRTLTAMTSVSRRALILQEVTTIAPFEREGSTQHGVFEWRYDYRTRLGERGWTCRAFVPQLAEPNRPGAVMTFVKETRE